MLTHNLCYRSTTAQGLKEINDLKDERQLLTQYSHHINKYKIFVLH